MKLKWLGLVFAFVSILSFGNAQGGNVERVIKNAMKNKVFPGAVTVVGDIKSGFLSYHISAFGNYTYGEASPFPRNGVANPSVLPNTLYDLASVTKVASTTTAALVLYDMGFINLDEKVGTILPHFNNRGKESITLTNLLLHNAGFGPDPDPVWYDPSFPCPNNNELNPAEDFSCIDFIYANILNQTLAYPTGEKYLYSDLSMLTMMFVLGTVVHEHRQHVWLSQEDYSYFDGCGPDVYRSLSTPKARLCDFAAFTKYMYRDRIHASDYLGRPIYADSIGYRPKPAHFPDAAPTYHLYNQYARQLQGQVCDGNSYAMGGVAGHAGFFASGRDLAVLAHSYLTHSLASEASINKFTTMKNGAQSSRALGWNTNHLHTGGQDGQTHICGTFPETSYNHMGYTGTLICINPVDGMYAILLDNAVYPDDTHPHAAAVEARRNFASAAYADWKRLHP